MLVDESKGSTAPENRSDADDESRLAKAVAAANAYTSEQESYEETQRGRQASMAHFDIGQPEPTSVSCCTRSIVLGCIFMSAIGFSITAVFAKEAMVI